MRINRVAITAMAIVLVFVWFASMFGSTIH